MLRRSLLISILILLLHVASSQKSDTAVSAVAATAATFNLLADTFPPLGFVSSAINFGISVFKLFGASEPPPDRVLYISLTNSDARWASPSLYCQGRLNSGPQKFSLPSDFKLPEGGDSSILVFNVDDKLRGQEIAGVNSGSLATTGFATPSQSFASATLLKTDELKCALKVARFVAEPTNEHYLFYWTIAANGSVLNHGSKYLFNDPPIDLDDVGTYWQTVYLPAMAENVPAGEVNSKRFGDDCLRTVSMFYRLRSNPFGSFTVTSRLGSTVTYNSTDPSKRWSKFQNAGLESRVTLGHYCLTQLPQADGLLVYFIDVCSNFRDTSQIWFWINDRLCNFDDPFCQAFWNEGRCSESGDLATTLVPVGRSLMSRSNGLCFTANIVPNAIVRFAVCRNLPSQTFYFERLPDARR